MRTKPIVLIVALLFAFTGILWAQEDPAHKELRELRDAMISNMNRGDIEGQLQLLHPNVVVTWHNAEVSRGRDGVRKYLERMLKQEPKFVEKFSADVDVDELSIIYGGDTAIAFGSTREHFVLRGNRPFDLLGRWSATVVKEDGKWLVANIHTSDNIFENPLLNAAKNNLFTVGGIAIALGLLAGWFIGKRTLRA